MSSSSSIIEEVLAESSGARMSPTLTSDSDLMTAWHRVQRGNRRLYKGQWARAFEQYCQGVRAATIPASANNNVSYKRRIAQSLIAFYEPIIRNLSDHLTHQKQDDSDKEEEDNPSAPLSVPFQFDSVDQAEHNRVEYMKAALESLVNEIKLTRNARGQKLFSHENIDAQFPQIESFLRGHPYLVFSGDSPISRFTFYVDPYSGRITKPVECPFDTSRVLGGPISGVCIGANRDQKMVLFHHKSGELRCLAPHVSSRIPPIQNAERGVDIFVQPYALFTVASTGANGLVHVFDKKGTLVSSQVFVRTQVAHRVNFPYNRFLLDLIPKGSTAIYYCAWMVVSPDYQSVQVFSCLENLLAVFDYHGSQFFVEASVGSIYKRDESDPTAPNGKFTRVCRGLKNHNETTNECIVMKDAVVLFRRKELHTKKENRDFTFTSIFIRQLRQDEDDASIIHIKRMPPFFFRGTISSFVILDDERICFQFHMYFHSSVSRLTVFNTRSMQVESDILADVPQTSSNPFVVWV